MYSVRLVYGSLRSTATLVPVGTLTPTQVRPLVPLVGVTGLRVTPKYGYLWFPCVGVRLVYGSLRRRYACWSTLPLVPLVVPLVYSVTGHSQVRLPLAGRLRVTPKYGYLWFPCVGVRLVYGSLRSTSE